MFILGWFVILILRANDVVIPSIVSLLVGILAIGEAGLYIFIFVMWIISMIVIFRDK